MIFVIAVAAVMLPVLLGLGLAAGFARFDRVVEETKEEVNNKDRGYNPAQTMGYRIRTTEDVDKQIKEARLLAAKKAAATPRGANVRIGTLGNSMLKSAWQGVEDDPLTAVRIAEFHGWEGVKSGAVMAQPGAAPVAAAGAAAGGKIKLEPGKDYPVIEITDDMPKEEKAKARIANSKAKYAAYKAAKASGAPATAGTMAVPAATTSSTAAAATQAPQAQAAAAINIEPPTYIELTDDMTKQEKAKARIANSKAKSAYNKALKAAGIDPKTVKDGQVVTAAAAAPAAAAPAATAAPETPAAPAAAAPDVSSIPKPEYIEITDDMPKEEKAKARIANSKAKSAYNKALKAAGIDPKSVK